jgi:hypothetical protein
MKSHQPFSEEAKARLIRLLQNAHAGERAAFLAYEGHAVSVNGTAEHDEIRKIQREEWEHRECLGRFLIELGSGPRSSREFLMTCIGRFISLFCLVGGWFIPMYGAGKLERGNIVEYEVAARLARDAGFTHMANPLLEMAEIEWDHELYFREKSLSHWLSRIIPVWDAPPTRAKIRESFATETPAASRLA